MRMNEAEGFCAAQGGEAVGQGEDTDPNFMKLHPACSNVRTIMSSQYLRGRQQRGRRFV
jgi:hypothetical protein